MMIWGEHMSEPQTAALLMPKDGKAAANIIITDKFVKFLLFVPLCFNSFTFYFSVPAVVDFYRTFKDDKIHSSQTEAEK